MLFVNGVVFTAEGEDAFASAFRIEDGRFTWVGDDPTPRDGEEVHDLSGATVLPGFLDVHTHPAFSSTLVEAVNCLPPEVSSREDLIAALGTAPGLGKGPDVWIEGFGFDECRFPEAKWPTRHDLDQVSTTQPVLVRRCCGHSAACNTFALNLAGITRDTPDPEAGHIGKDADGEPDGRLIEPAAVNLVYDLIPETDRAGRVRRLAKLGEHYRDRGIVGVCDLFATWISDPLELMREASKQSWFPDASLFLYWENISENPPTLTEAELQGQVHVGGVKILMDGSYSNKTAWTHDSYPGTCTHGMRTTSQEDLEAAAAWARANGVQLAAHAMGDAAIDTVIDTFADQEGWLEDRPSIRIEHATLFTPERIDRLRNAKMNFGAISHTIFFHAEYSAYENNLSPEQYRAAYPIRSFYELVPATALSSDSPATAHSDADNVFVSVEAAVRRRAWNGADIGQDQAITVPQALLLYTSRAASCASLPGLGRIAPGYAGTFVVLDRDVFSVPDTEISQVKVAQTWVRGEALG